MSNATLNIVWALILLQFTCIGFFIYRVQKESGRDSDTSGTTTDQPGDTPNPGGGRDHPSDDPSNDPSDGPRNTPSDDRPRPKPGRSPDRPYKPVQFPPVGGGPYEMPAPAGAGA